MAVSAARAATTFRLPHGSASTINAKHERHGHLFGARFFNRILEDPGYRREVARYLALNPVRAGLAAHPDGWTWSSYAGTIGHAPTAAFVSSFIVDEWFERNTAGYRAWVLAGGRSERECLEVLLEAYEPITAVRLAMDTHGIEFAAVAAFLGIKPRTLRERLWTAR